MNESAEGRPKKETTAKASKVSEWASRVDASSYGAHLQLLVEVNGISLRDMSLPEEKLLALPFGPLRYLDWGNQKGHPLLFLHGGGLTAHSWDVVCLILRQLDYRCIALDLRGHGDSAWSDDYSLDAHVGDVRAVADALELAHPGVVGQSLGGLIALRYAERFSDVGPLVIIDVGPNSGDSPGAKAINHFLDGAELESVDDFIERSLDFNPRRSRLLLRTSLLRNLRRLANGRWTWKYDLHQYREARSEEFLRSVTQTWRAVPTIRCHTLIVRGGESEILTLEDGRRLASDFQRGEFAEVQHSGHTVQGDNPTGLAKAMVEFFKGIEMVERDPKGQDSRGSG